MKDRAAAAILREAERQGRLRPETIILDATSGNTGIAYAMIAAARGFRLMLCLPDNVTVERKRTLEAYGAELILTDPMEGTDGAIREARRRHAAEPDRYFYAGPIQQRRELARALRDDRPGDSRADRRPRHAFRRGPGHERHVRRRGPAPPRVQPGDPSGVRAARLAAERDRRAQAHGDRDLPGIYDPSLADEDVRITTERAQALTRRLAVEEGLLVGVSSGAALAASLDLASRVSEGLIVTIFPDSGTRYLSERFWEEGRA